MTTGPFVLPNLVVLTVPGGEIQRFVDFVNILAAFIASFSEPTPKVHNATPGNE